MVQRSPAPFVGRLDHLALLHEVVADARNGAPRVVLVSGDTGIGKSRLVREVVDREDVVLLYGACLPVAGDPLPFAPLTQALRRLVADGLLRLPTERWGDLARLLPDDGGAGGAGGADGGSTGREPASQLRLFQAVLLLLERLGARAPVLLVVEDVHWADRSTLDLLRFLAVNLVAERVVVLATYRSDALRPGSLHLAWLADLGRLAVSTRVALEPLATAEGLQLVRALSGDEADDDLLEATLARSAGNPLFAEQLVLHGGVDPLPATLSELLDVRVRQLPEATRDLLRAAAVLARPVTVDLLAATSGTSGVEVEHLLRSAIDQHVMVLRRDDLVAFRHPAIGEVVSAGILPGERSRLHRAAALALEASGAGPAELARHWMGAGDGPRALDAAVAAGVAAEHMYAFADAHANYVRAIALLEEVPVSTHDWVWLHEQAAQAASLFGGGAEAGRLVEAALARTAEPATRASLLTRLGGIHYLAGRGPQAEERFRQALGLLPVGEQSVLRARILAGLALFGAAWSRLSDADEAIELGLAVSRATGARREEGLVLNAMGVVAAARGDLCYAVVHLTAALSVAEELGQPNDLATAYINLTHALGLAGRVDEVVRMGQDGNAALTRVGLAQQSGSFLKANVAYALVEAGRVDEASVVIAQALSRHPRGITVVPVLTEAARIALVRGDLDIAWERIEQARAAVDDAGAPDAWLRVLLELAAETEVWKGRADAAYDLVVDGLTLISGTEQEGAASVLVALGHRALADRAETARGDEARDRLRQERLVLERAAAWTPHPARDLVALRLLREAERGRCDRTNDPQAWSAVGQAWRALGRPYPAAYAQWREGEARLDRGHDAEGVACLRAADHAARSLGADRLVEEVGRLAGWHRIDLLPFGTAPSLVETVALDAYRLTARELEVLSGLAAGRTNQEIADALVISVKTASVHVSNILRKLDVSGRQEAARLAHRLGVRV